MNDLPREPQPPEDVDEFYRRASALDPSRPGELVRRKLLAHAAELAAVRARSRQRRLRWQPAVFGTLAAAVLAGLAVAPHWLSLPSPAATAPTPEPSASPASQLAREATPAAPAPAAPSDAYAPPAPRPAVPREAAAPAPAAPPRAAPPAAAREDAADAGLLGRLPGNTAEIAARSPGTSAARAAASPVAGLAEPAPQETLRRAADTGDLATLRRLLGANANIDARDSQGRTALMHAVLHGQAQAVELLLAAGASPTATDRDGTTPLQAAEAGGKRAIVEALQRYGAR